jgi:hypothetical protein
MIFMTNMSGLEHGLERLLANVQVFSFIKFNSTVQGPNIMAVEAYPQHFSPGPCPISGGLFRLFRARS